MNSEKDRPTGKISYEKPTAVDLGPTASIVGASCVSGASIDQGGCRQVGNGAADNCSPFGHSAGGGCKSTGSSAGAGCDNGGGGADNP
jgi:hypothetical protein